MDNGYESTTSVNQKISNINITNENRKMSRSDLISQSIVIIRVYKKIMIYIWWFYVDTILTVHLWNSNLKKSHKRHIYTLPFYTRQFAVFTLFMHRFMSIWEIKEFSWEFLVAVVILKYTRTSPIHIRAHIQTHIFVQLFTVAFSIFNRQLIFRRLPNYVVALHILESQSRLGLFFKPSFSAQSATITDSFQKAKKKKTYSDATNKTMS